MSTDTLVPMILGGATFAIVYGLIQLSKQLDLIYKRLGEIADLLRKKG